MRKRRKKNIKQNVTSSVFLLYFVLFLMLCFNCNNKKTKNAKKYFRFVVFLRFKDVLLQKKKVFFFCFCIVFSGCKGLPRANSGISTQCGHYLFISILIYIFFKLKSLESSKVFFTK